MSVAGRPGSGEMSGAINVDFALYSRLVAIYPPPSQQAKSTIRVQGRILARQKHRAREGCGLGKGVWLRKGAWPMDNSKGPAERYLAPRPEALQHLG